MSDEPFGRQPRPVTVSIHGEQADVDYWYRELARRSQFKGDNVEGFTSRYTIFHENPHTSGFTIFPRAVND